MHGKKHIEDMWGNKRGDFSACYPKSYFLNRDSSFICFAYESNDSPTHQKLNY